MPQDEPCKVVVSVIIPALNEAAHLAQTLTCVLANSTRHEVIVVDGGSEDCTLAIAAAAGARTMSAPGPNRAAQMNLGAHKAIGPVFLFLHADTTIGNTSLAQIE